MTDMECLGLLSMTATRCAVTMSFNPAHNPNPQLVLLGLAVRANPNRTASSPTSTPPISRFELLSGPPRFVGNLPTVIRSSCRPKRAHRPVVKTPLNRSRWQPEPAQHCACLTHCACTKECVSVINPNNILRWLHVSNRMESARVGDDPMCVCVHGTGFYEKQDTF